MKTVGFYEFMCFSGTDCGVHGCGMLETDAVLFAACMTDDEREAIEDQIATNYAKRHYKTCLNPDCGIFGMDDDSTAGSKRICTLCKYEWCKECEEKWMNGSDYRICGNEGCNTVEKADLKELIDPPKKTISGIADCPSIRMCPNCERILRHESACKHVKTDGCSCEYEFCFICLKPWGTGSGECSLATPCTPAPIQLIT